MTVRDPDKSHRQGRTIGQGMLIVCFALGLAALTLFFDGRLESQLNPNRRPQHSEGADGAREVVLRRNRQGHYVSGGEINGVPVTFLLDTGATDVAIPAEVARKARLARGPAGRASTANGTVTVWSTEVDELVLGNIVLNDVAASITPSMEGDTILLGMSALRRVEFSQRGASLTLRHTP